MITHAHVTERQGQATAKLAGLARVRGSWRRMERTCHVTSSTSECLPAHRVSTSRSRPGRCRGQSAVRSWTKLADYCEIPASDRSYYTHNGNAFYAAETNDWHIYTAGVADEDENPHPDREEEND